MSPRRKSRSASDALRFCDREHKSREHVIPQCLGGPLKDSHAVAPGIRRIRASWSGRSTCWSSTVDTEPPSMRSCRSLVAERLRHVASRARIHK
jgi:hypothetical protein